MTWPDELRSGELLLDDFVARYAGGLSGFRHEGPHQRASFWVELFVRDHISDNRAGNLG